MICSQDRAAPMRTLSLPCADCVEELCHALLVDHHVVCRESLITPVGLRVPKARQLREGILVVLVAAPFWIIVAFHEIRLAFLVERTEIAQQNHARIPENVIFREAVLRCDFRNPHLQKLLQIPASGRAGTGLRSQRRAGFVAEFCIEPSLNACAGDLW